MIAALNGFLDSNPFYREIDREMLMNSLRGQPVVNSKEFFKWTLRDGNDPRIFIHYPQLAKKLKRSLLSARVGRFAKNRLLQFHEENRDVTLAIVGPKGKRQDISILDIKKIVTLEHGYQLSVKEIFELFSKKKYRGSAIEMSERGVKNFNTTTMTQQKRDGTVKKIPFTEIPPFETLSKEEAIRRFALKKSDLEDEKWIFSVRATRPRPNLEISSHTYLSFLIPKEGKYSLYPIGKWGPDFDVGIIGFLSICAGTVPATYNVWDSFEFSSFQQHASLSCAITPEKGREIFQSVQESLERISQGMEVYQFSWSNCGFWVQKYFNRLFDQKEEAPDLFRTQLVETDSQFYPFHLVFKTIRTLSPLPKKGGILFRIALLWRMILVHLLYLPLLPWRGRCIRTKEGPMRYESLIKTPFSRLGEVFLPSALHDRIERGLFKSYPHLRTRLWYGIREF